MTSKRVMMKADVKANENFKSRHPRVSKKKTYFDVIDKFEVDQSIGEIEINEHPCLRKSVGSIKITDMIFDNAGCEDAIDETILSSQSISDEKRDCPVHLFNAEPTQIHEITDSFIVARIQQDKMILALSKREKKFGFVKSFVKTLFSKSIIKKIPKEHTKLNGLIDFSPEEEFRKLHESHVPYGSIPMRELGNGRELKRHNKKCMLDPLGKLNVYHRQSVTSVTSDIVLNSQFTSTDNPSHSSDSIETNTGEENKQYFNDSANNRFKIDKDFSDFSLQNRSVSPRQM